MGTTQRYRVPLVPTRDELQRLTDEAKKSLRYVPVIDEDWLARSGCPVLLGYWAVVPASHDEAEVTS